MQNNINYKSRFRILKGGKISLVVSALLVSASVGTPVFAQPANVVISTPTDVNTSGYPFDGSSANLNVTSSGSLYTTHNGTTLTISALGLTHTVSNDGNITIDYNLSTAIDINTSATDGNITYTGTISATSTGYNAYGIKVNGDLNGTISNSGTISATSNKYASGIYVSGDLNGTISNSGTISATSTNKYASGILVYGNLNGTINNSGTISATSTNSKAYGIFVYGNLNGTINNSGTISATSTTSKAYGIYAYGKLYGTISNSGTISATSTNSKASGIYAYGKLYGTITNDGNISATSNSARSDGVKISELHGTLVNSGTITVNSNQGGAHGLEAGYLYAGSSITNSGTITVDSNQSDAYGLTGVLDAGSSITNSGTITVDSNQGNAYGLTGDLYAGSSITNSGTINANATAGNYSYGLKANVNTDNNSTVTNSGTLKATIDNALDVNGYALYGSSNFTNTSSGKIYGNINITGAGTFQNAGLISLPYNANTASTPAYVKNFTNTASGTLEIGLKTDGTNTTHSKLHTANATFQDGSTINVNVLDSSTNVANIAGTTLSNVVYADTNLTVNGTIKVTDNSALLNFEYVKNANAIDLNVVEGKTITESTVSGGGGNSAIAAAGALDTINSNIASHLEMTSTITALNALGTNEEVARAVESTTPQTTSAGFGAATQISNGVAGIVQQRQNVNIGNTSGGNSGDIMLSQKNLWFKPFGSYGEQNNKDGINGFNISSYGFGIGVDAEYQADDKLGFGLFYTRANLDVHNVNQSSNLDVITALVYGNYRILDEKTNLLYQLGYAWQKTDSTRTLFTGTTATSNYTANTASLDLRLVRDYEVNKNLLLRPMVTTTYRHFTNPAYSEQGAGALNLNVDKFTSSELLAGLGSMLDYKLDKVSKVVSNVNVNYDLRNDQQIVNSVYQGAAGVSFATTAGIDNGRWSYDAGVGYERDITEGSNINISYNYQGQGTSFSNHVISARYIYKF